MGTNILSFHFDFPGRVPKSLLIEMRLKSWARNGSVRKAKTDKAAVVSTVSQNNKQMHGSMSCNSRSFNDTNRLINAALHSLYTVLVAGEAMVHSRDAPILLFLQNK